MNTPCTNNKTNQENDFLWFEKHYPEFQKRYGNVFLAIKNKQILGVYKTYSEGVHAASQTEELGTFIIQECSTTRKAYIAEFASPNLKII